MLERYYNLFDASKDYTELLFRAGDGLQSRELNELQSTFNHRLRGVADVLFKDGDIVEGGAARVDPDTGAAALSAGLIYLQGMVRPVGVGAFTIPVTGTFALGLRLQRVAVTELEDPSLREPAVGVRNYQEPGAGRVQERLVWGWSGDGEAGTFYPLYAVVDGLLQGREAPPNLDAVATAIAAYDRQSTGGTYLIEGLVASRQADVEGAEQVVRVSAGAARINGQSVTLPVDRRLTRLPVPDTGEIIAEPHLCESAGVERITTHRAPIATITQVTLTREITESVVHGAYSGAVDSLAQSPVIALISVTQGATTYAVGTDYSLVAGKVDWSAGGAEPAVGSTYEVTYRFIDTVTPTALDAEGFSVEGAVPGTLINVTYHWKRPRYDRLYLDPDGAFLWQTGVPHDDAPTIPAALSGRLLLATFFQSWRDGEDHISRDGARLVPMDELGAIRNNIGDIYTLLADQHLMLNASARESAAKKGLFVDSFRTHAQRDLGIAQNAWNDGGRLSLPITTRVDYVPNDIATDWVMPAHVDRVVIEQPAYSGTQLVNPYLAVEPIPAQCVLTPSVDNYSATDTTWVSPVWGSRSEVRTLSSQTVEMAIRTLSVAFALSGFGVGETVASMTFDGIPITPSDLVADAGGRLTGRFVIPSGVPAGHKEVEIIGTGGSRAIAVYTAKNTLVSVEQQQVNVRASSRRSSSSSSSSQFIAWGGGGLHVGGGATYSL
ncbi:DUF4815 domain-containing protein, partial [Lamprobacter modestohalophilus]|uniref:DUF4815 domain-containing protein n=1 Tax=Lamprobacter modestohalophilus TaxID=1064514 RepID=UPI002ADEE197